MMIRELKLDEDLELKTCCQLKGFGWFVDSRFEFDQVAIGTWTGIQFETGIGIWKGFDSGCCSFCWLIF